MFVAQERGLNWKCIFVILWLMGTPMKYVTIKFRIYREKQIITEGNVLEIFREVREMMS